MLDVFWIGLFLGVSIAVPIGPANLEIIKRGLAGGSREALEVGFGTAASDALLSFLVYLGVVPLLLRIGVVKILLYAGGGVVLVAIGLVSLYHTYACDDPLALPDRIPGDPFTERYRNMNPVLLGFLINTTNPMVIGFWILFFSSAVQHRLLGRHLHELLLFSGAVFTGSLAWFTLLSTVVLWGRRFVGRVAYMAVASVCNIAMIGVGSYFVLSALGLIGREMP